MISGSKNVYNDKLDDLVNIYNNTYQHNQNEANQSEVKHIYFDFVVKRWRKRT